jgi:programmed cell death 6-interacting protein
MELAYWKWREVVGNAEEGIKVGHFSTYAHEQFYHDFANLLARLKETCKEWVYSRRVDVNQMTQQFERTSVSSPPPPGPVYTPAATQPCTTPAAQFSSQPSQYSPAPAQFSHAPAAFSPPPPAPYSPPAPARGPPSFKPSFSLSHPSSSQWQTEADFLPPPPPAPVLRSTAPRAAPPQPQSPAPSTPSKRVTRSSGRADIGDAARNPYQKGVRKEGGGVV